MSHVQLESAAQHEVLAVLAHLEKGENSEATAYFAGNLNGDFLGRTFTKDPDLAARRVDPTHRRLPNQGVLGLLRSTEVAAQRFVGLLHVMDRTLIRWGNWAPFLQRLLFQ
jgi:hypothetical protein